MIPVPTIPLDDRWLIGELRSNHAGESGAVAIYYGILSVSRNKDVRAFAREHLATERQHLDIMNALVPRGRRSIFTPLWWVAGWLTGALPALFGPRAVFLTIESVERFVEEHYQRQIDRLRRENREEEVRGILEQCCAEEVHHRLDASQRYSGPTTAGGRLWTSAVSTGSHLAAMIAKLI